MFQTTKQLMIMESMSIHVYTIYIYMWNYMESCLGMEMGIGFKSIDSEVNSNLNKFQCELTYLNLISI